jgi:hypothetical protein
MGYKIQKVKEQRVTQKQIFYFPAVIFILCFYTVLLQFTFKIYEYLNLCTMGYGLMMQYFIRAGAHNPHNLYFGQWRIITICVIPLSSKDLLKKSGPELCMCGKFSHITVPVATPSDIYLVVEAYEEADIAIGVVCIATVVRSVQPWLDLRWKF